MKRYLLLALSVLCFATTFNAQEKVTKRVVQKGQVTNTKTHYNYFLLDAVNDSDAAYAEYESVVQQVWEEKIPAISLKNEKGKAIRAIDDYLELVKTTPTYQGGEEYRTAVLAYIIAVKDKVNALENLGILGADKDSDATAYNKASIKFTDLSNEAIDLRNIVRNKKSDYEKTFYIKKK